MYVKDLKNNVGYVSKVNLRYGRHQTYFFPVILITKNSSG